MSHTVFLDESGDLGFKFDRPYRVGGSSRFLTMGFIIIPDTKKHLLKRIVKDTYIKYNFAQASEVKGSQLNTEQKNFIVRKLISLIQKHQDILICAITVNKVNVQAHIQTDSNLLYNYMMRLSVVNKIKHYSKVNLIRDNKSVKISSGNTLKNYLQTTLWFDCNASTTLIDIPSDSKAVRNLVLVDWLNNIVFNHYESNNSEPFNHLRPYLKINQLFF